jgi:Tfp pilus assembly protein PilW
LEEITKRCGIMDLQNNRKGFAIVELLLVLGLSGLVTAIAFMLYFSGTKAWNRAENQMEVQQNLRIAINTLSTEVRKADFFEIIQDNRKITLTYPNGSSKSYSFHPASGEIRISESGATVAMHIKDCKFFYENGLITLEITTKEIEGIEERVYSFGINARGKKSNG